MNGLDVLRLARAFHVLGEGPELPADAAGGDQLARFVNVHLHRGDVLKGPNPGQGVGGGLYHA